MGGDKFLVGPGVVVVAESESDVVVVIIGVRAESLGPGLRTGCWRET